MAVDPSRAKSLFLKASEIPEPAERVAFLDRECGDAGELRARVEALLRADAAPLPLPNTDNPTVASGLDQLPTRDAAMPTENARRACAADTITVPHAPALEGRALIAGRYMLMEKIGEGGMGEVWVAKQSEPVKRRVALKLIKPGMDSRAVLQRFELERQALAMMEHPNIARVFDAGLTPAAQPFFAMELVNGLPLTKFCDEARLTPRERLDLFVPICQAVQHAHQKGIVHRDLKPANILVTLIDGNAVPKIIDFGVAKATAGKLTAETMSTQFGAVVGTLEYMSPEQAGFAGDDIDTRADIYSLGVILYELLTGLRPIDANRLKKAAIGEMIRVIQEEEPSKPSTRLSTDESLPSLAALRQTEPRRLMTMLRGELDWVVMKCLEKSRERRYETANALGRDIQRYLADEPVEARPPSIGYRLTKFVRRNRLLATAAGFVLLAILLGAGVAVWQAVVATRAEQGAKADRDVARLAQRAEAKASAAANEARKQAILALDESQRKTASMTYERAQSMCEQGEADLGLLWMARSLELTPESAHDLDRAIRTSINLWAVQLNTYETRHPSTNEWALGQELLDVSVSPDGRSVLALGQTYPQPIAGPRFFDFETGKLQREFLLEAGAPASGPWQECRTVFSPAGRYVAACRGDTRARVWNAATGQLVAKPIDHGKPVRGVCIDPTEKTLIAAAGSTIAFNTVESGERDGEPIALDHDANGVEISRDGRLVLAWSSERVTICDAAQRKRLRSLEAVDFPVICATFSPDSSYVLANGETDAQFWDVATGKPLGARMRWVDHSNPAWHAHRASIRNDGRVAVTGGFPIHMWGVPTGEPLGAESLSADTYFPAFTPDGRRLIVGGRVVDIAPGLLPMQQLPQKPIVGSLVVSPDGRILGIQEQDGSEQRNRFVDLHSGKQLGEPSPFHFVNARPPLPVFSPDSATVVLMLGEKAGELRDSLTGQSKGNVFRMDEVARAAAFSADGRIVATGDLGGVVRLWNAHDGRPIGKPMIHRQPVWRLQFSTDGRKLLSAGGNIGGLKGEARLWDPATCEPLGPPLDILGTVQDAAISPDGQSVAIGAFQLSIWDAATSRLRWRDTRWDIWQIAFAPDSQFVLAHSFTQPLAGVYDVQTGALRASMKHQTGIHRSALSPDGRLVLTSGDDLLVRLWDSATGLPLGPTRKALKRSPVAIFDSDGQSILLADDAHISRWPLSAPIEGLKQHVRLSVEVMTRLQLDDREELQALAPTWSQELNQEGKRVMTEDPYVPASKRLQELGGPVGNFQRSQLR